MKTFTDIIKFTLLAALPLAAAAAYALMGIAVLPENTEAAQYLLYGLLAFAGFTLSRFLHSVFHELGHLAAGMANGFAFHTFRAGILRITREDGKLKATFARPNAYSGMLTLVSTSPHDAEKRYLKVTAGGLVASALFTAASAVPFFFADSLAGGWFFLLGAALPSCLYLFLRNALPFVSAGAYTDGAVISGLLRQDAPAMISVRLIIIQSLLRKGLSPAEIDSDYFLNIPMAADNDVNKIQMKIYTYAHYLDKGDMENAEKQILFLEENIEHLPEIFIDSARTDIFYHTARVRGDIERAKNMYMLIKPYVDSEPDICNLRIRMTYELICRDKPLQAIATGKTALANQAAFPLPGIAKMEASLINGMLAEAKPAAEVKRPLFEDMLTEYKD